jgi:hypothetical protein
MGDIFFSLVFRVAIVFWRHKKYSTKGNMRKKRIQWGIDKKSFAIKTISQAETAIK